MQCKRFEGKVAIVTASTAGIGKAIATQLAKEGAKVVVSSRKEQNVNDTVRELASQQLQVMGVPCNVGEEADRKRLIEQTVQTWGQVDILVSNAAVNPAIGRLTKVSSALFDKTMNVNVKSALMLVQAVRPHMPAHGSIVFVSSILGYNLERPIALYGITKTALIGLSKALANELGSDGIRVNCVAPGVVPTKFSEALVGSEQMRAIMESRAALGRLGKAEEIAQTVCFLASDNASYITGETIVVAGGTPASKL